MPVRSCSVTVIRDPACVPEARRWVRAQVAGWGVQLDDHSQAAIEVVTSELVTNAVRHTTATWLTVGLYANPRLRRVLVEVYDGSAALPRVRMVGPDQESGRGLLLVERLSLKHGAERTERGKKVWAELELPEQPLMRRQLMGHPRRAARALARQRSGHRRPRIRPPWPSPAR
ncbi:ATP-binding protein [Kitasatospora sp. NBC_01287]|uniref:ATP-binding protein n=1 Tax=Kitasatospora sp. NBC_01287 TaxID=2903573 RepID=UPI0022571518|nr:ATP-binding protein [Kitasatospora sp. NBC_01287]MCX4745309.1 ATP-binding protein [Kitasatospora sp. NBC_01287]